MKLTPNQEKFCQLVADGNNYSDAYREAYPASQKWKDKTVNESASRLYSKVSARVETIRGEIAKKNLWTREESVKVLADIARQSKREADRIAAIKELNSMHGFKSTEKHDITNSDGTLRPTTIEIIAVDGKTPDTTTG